MYIVDEKAEKAEILKRYKHLLSINKNLSQEQKRSIRRAFTISLKAHEGMRRKAGEPYIFHPIEVARIAAEELGLGADSIICALLHDVVEDTNYVSLEDIQSFFGDTVAKIIDGLTKIKDVFDHNSNSIQAENFKKLLLTMVDDVRVILIKLCDRLHNMRTLEYMPSKKQLAISSETMFLYIPLAHRLGLYAIKSEMEDLVMRYTNPKEYFHIKTLLEESQPDREYFIQSFTKPIIEKLNNYKYLYSLTGRIKSVYSIWNKMQKKDVDFQEVYDVFAIRIVLDVPEKLEKQECFKMYSLIVSLYKGNPARFRDWISSPKANGYEAIHTTVMSDSGKWVEVQIRSKRMDIIAEKGMAAHFRYKEEHQDENTESAFDIWLQETRIILENTSNNALELLDDFKMNLYMDEIFVFTPKGKMISLPKNASVLDFAYAVHTDLGFSCMGAKVNFRVVSSDHILKSGDQVQILTSKKIEPEEEWLLSVKTAYAKQKIRQSLREKKKKYRAEGEEVLKKIFKDAGILSNTANILKVKNALELKSDTDFYYNLAMGIINEKQITSLFKKHEKSSPWLVLTAPFVSLFQSSSSKKTHPNELEFSKKLEENIKSILIEEGEENLPTKTASCCNPIPGDEVIGFIDDKEIIIHRTNCLNMIELMSKYKNRIVKTKWRENEKVTFLAGLKIEAIDRKGLLQDVVNLISSEKALSMRGLSLETSKGVCVGVFMIYIPNLESLNDLIHDLKKLEGVESVIRM